MVWSVQGLAAFSSHTAFAASLTVAPDDAKPMSTIGLLERVFGSVLAFAWAVTGAWLGVRRQQVQTPINKLGCDGIAAADLIAGSAHAALCGPPNEGMRWYDEAASKAVGHGGASVLGEGQDRDTQLDRRLARAIVGWRAGSGHMRLLYWHYLGWHSSCSSANAAGTAPQ
jgi:hypothetical protein